MILSPLESPLDFTSKLHPPEQKEGLWFVFSKDALLVAENTAALPFRHDVKLQRTLYLGTLRDVHIFAGEIADISSPTPGWQWSSLKSLYSIVSEEMFALAGRALQLVHWDRTSQFCGHCGNPTFHRQNERCRECRVCKQLFYPKVAPVAMVLVKKGSKILLARGLEFPGQWYSVLAGFVDPGETLEQCVAREVYEEVGIKVKNIQYFRSQPWPFSYSLIMGFTCECSEGELHIDPKEIEVADWFDVSNLPELPPKLSLAYDLIASHVDILL